jgi:hypothetical protein
MARSLFHLKNFIRFSGDLPVLIAINCEGEHDDTQLGHFKDCWIHFMEFVVTPDIFVNGFNYNSLAADFPEISKAKPWQGIFDLIDQLSIGDLVNNGLPVHITFVQCYGKL